METIFDPRRLAPLMKSAARAVENNRHARALLAQCATITRAVGTNPIGKGARALASVVLARLKANPSLAGVLASGLAVLIFVSASPTIFQTLAMPARGAPVPIEAPLLFPPPPAAAGEAAAAAAAKAAEVAAREAAQKTVTPAPPRPSLQSIGPEAFIERFSKINEDRWYLADRGSNGDWTVNDFHRTQLSLSEAGLNLTLAKAPPGWATPFSSGEISSHERFRYGYFEARLRAPRGLGLDTGLFTYARDKGPDGWNEIDIELIGGNTRQVEFALHVGKLTAHKVVELPFDAASGFHTYAFNWQPGSVTWYVDDRVVYVERGPAATGLTRAQNFVIDIWGSETLYRWMGKIDRNGGPYTATVSCFAYLKSYAGRSLCSDPDIAPEGNYQARSQAIVAR